MMMLVELLAGASSHEAVHVYVYVYVCRFVGYG